MDTSYSEANMGVLCLISGASATALRLWVEEVMSMEALTGAFLPTDGDTA